MMDEFTIEMVFNLLNNLELSHHIKIYVNLFLAIGVILLSIIAWYYKIKANKRKNDHEEILTDISNDMCSKLQNMISNLEHSNKSLNVSIEELKSEKFSILTEINSLKIENKKLEHENINLNNLINSLKTDNMSLNDRIIKIITINEGQTSKIISLEKEIVTLQSSINTLVLKYENINKMKKIL
jgi:chromosome segregation ATPase